MSSPENNCVENLCQNCTGSICTSCTESCTASCEENCQDACNQACSNACNQACSNACSNVTCTCGTPSINIFSTLIVTICLPLFTLVILGIIQAFDPRGPLLITIFGSSILAISLSGVNVNNIRFSSSCRVKFSEYSSRIGFLTINHSHHPHELIDKGHEFKIKGKYFCTGCYGLFIGTILGLVLAGIYLLFGFSEFMLLLIGFIIPMCFVPIILRYTILEHPGTSLRLISNSLLPVGCCLLLILLDYIFHLWILNVIMVIIIVIIAYIRSIVALKENQKIK